MCNKLLYYVALWDSHRTELKSISKCDGQLIFNISQENLLLATELKKNCQYFDVSHLFTELYLSHLKAIPFYSGLIFIV